MKNKKGQVLVETALILPLLFVLIFGLVDFGRAMYTRNTLNNAARAGARVAAVTSPLSDEAGLVFSPSPTPTALAVQTNMYNVVSKDNTTVSYQLTRWKDGTLTSGTFLTGDQAQVIVTYPDFPMITPLYKMLGLITGSDKQGSNTLTITGSASMRYE